MTMDRLIVFAIAGVGGRRVERGAPPALVARADAGRHGGLSGGRFVDARRRRRLGMAERLCVGRRTPASAARRGERLVSGAGGGRGRRRGGLCPRVLAGSRAPGIGPARAGVVERAGAEHGAGAAVRQRTAFPHRVGSVRPVGVFPDHAGTGTAARCARRAGCIWRRRMPARSACSPSSPCWRRAPGAGISARCATIPELAPLFWLALFGFGVKAGMFPAAHLAAVGARQRAQPCLGDHVGRGDQDGASTASCASAAGCRCRPAAGWVVLGAGRGQRGAGRRVRPRAERSQAPARLLLGGKHRHHPDRPGRRRCWRATHGDAPWGRLALAGALLHVWNHGAVQVAAVLRRGLGAARHRHARDEPAGRTVARDAVDGRACSRFGAVAISGLPPLNGFVSEWLVYLGLFDAAAGHAPAAVGGDAGRDHAGA